jgi:ABC-2 type transport system permease protein
VGDGIADRRTPCYLEQLRGLDRECDGKANGARGGAMRVYVEVARCAFQQHLAYRTANLAGLATNAFWGVLRSFLFLGLYQSREMAAGWSVRDAVDYVWITQALIMPVYFWNWWEIATTIRTGDVVSDLAKPVDYYTFWLSRDAGRAVYHTLFRWWPTMLLGVLLFGVRLPAEAPRWGWFFLSMALAVWLSFGLRFLYNIAAFWLLDQRGVGALVSITAIFLSGFLVPLNYFPDWARGIVTWLPFAGMLQAPIEVLLGKLSGPALAGALAFQAAWGLALLMADRMLLALAVRRLIIQGG